MLVRSAFSRYFFGLYRRVFRLFFGTRIGEFPPLAWLHAKIMGSLQPPSVLVDGHRLCLDAGDSLNLSLLDRHEAAELALARGELGPGDVALDLGANIGVYTLTLAHAVGTAGKVIAFEPEPSNFALLSKNVELNGYQNVAAWPYAVGADAGTIKLYLSDSNRGDHRTFADGSRRRVIEVRCVRLDEFLDPSLQVRLIKMDIQGAEVTALQGMQSLLRRAQQLTLLTEFWPAGLSNAGSSAREYLDLLLLAGFQIFRIASGSGALRPFGPSQLEELPRDGCNLLCRIDRSRTGSAEG